MLFFWVAKKFASWLSIVPSFVSLFVTQGEGIRFSKIRFRLFLFSFNLKGFFFSIFSLYIEDLI